MKRIALPLLLLTMSASLFAFSFSLAPNTSFFEPLNSDQFSPKTHLGAFYLLDSDPKGNIIRFDKLNGTPGEYYPLINTYKEGKDDAFLLLQAAGGFSALNFDFGKVQLQAHIEAYIRGVFYLLHGNDVMGFDGSYFIGMESKIIDSLILRGGIRHYSGHVGDEVLYAVIQNNPDYIDAEISEYVRDTFEFSVGYSNKDFPYVEGAISFMIPQKNSYLLPFAHRPDNIISGGKTNAERDPESYAVRGDYGPSYKAIILAGELTLSYPFGMNNAFLSLSGKLHQDGVTKHTLDPSDDGGFWEYEYDVTLGIERFNQKGRSIAVELIWHDGRFPLLNYYWKRTKSVSLVFSVN